MKWSALAHGTKALPRRHLLGAIILSPAVGVPANAAPTPLPVVAMQSWSRWMSDVVGF